MHLLPSVLSKWTKTPILYDFTEMVDVKYVIRMLNDSNNT